MGFVMGGYVKGIERGDDGDPARGPEGIAVGW